MIVEGRLSALRREHNERVHAAWMTARLTAYPPAKPRDFIKVERLLAGETPKAPRQTWQEQMAIAQKWAAAAPKKRRE